MGLNKPRKKELIISIITFVGVEFILFITSSNSTLTAGSMVQDSYSGLPAATAPGLFNNGVKLSPGNSNDLATSVATSFSGSKPMSPYQTRVVNTSEGLVGELDYGSFERVSSEMISNLTSTGGYVESSNLMYDGTTWLGVYDVTVPSGKAVQFLH